MIYKCFIQGSTVSKEYIIDEDNHSVAIKRAKSLFKRSYSVSPTVVRVSKVPPVHVIQSPKKWSYETD